MKNKFGWSLLLVTSAFLAACSDSSSNSSDDIDVNTVSCTVKQNSNNVVKTEIIMGSQTEYTYTFDGDSVLVTSVMTFGSVWDQASIDEVCEDQKSNTDATVTCESDKITVVTKEKNLFSNDLTLLDMDKEADCKEFLAE